MDVNEGHLTLGIWDCPSAVEKRTARQAVLHPLASGSAGGLGQA